jgi:iron complex outermembrane receptor protein
MDGPLIIKRNQQGRVERIMFKRKILSLAWLFVGAQCVQAADGDLVDLNLEDLIKADITSVSRRSQSLADVPAAAFVITAEDIRRSGAQALPDVLRMAPGIEVAQIDNGRYAVTARCFNGRFANKLQVLVDGRSIYHPIFSGVMWELDPLPLEDIERIEIIRGPGAVMWGANAVNGVINIISKHARNQVDGAVNFTAGNNGNGALYARIGRSPDAATSWKLSIQGRRIDASQQYVSRQDSEDELRNGVIDFRFDRDLGAGSDFTLWANASRSKMGDLWNANPDISIPGRLSFSGLSLSQKLNSESLVARYRWLTDGGVESTLQGGLIHSGIDISNFFEETRDTLDIDYQGRYAFGRHDVLWGFSHRRSTDDVTPHEPYVSIAHSRYTHHNTGLFVHDDWTLLPERLKLGFGLRWDNTSRNGNHIAPNATLLWTPTRGDTAWFKYASAPRTAARAEQDISIFAGASMIQTGFGALPLVTYARPAENGLSAEKIAGVELGYRKQFTPTLNADLTVYHYHYTDLRTGSLAGLTACNAMFPPIPGVVVDPSRCLSVLQGSFVLQQEIRTANGLAAWHKGIELSADWLATPHWRLQLSYSSSRLSMEGATDPAMREDALIREKAAPRHMASLRSQWNLTPNQQLDLWLRGAGGFERNDVTDLTPSGTGAPRFVKVPGYVTLDLRYGVKINKDLEIALIGRNLAGPRRIEYLSDYVPTVATEIKPSWFISARLKF